MADKPKKSYPIRRRSGRIKEKLESHGADTPASQKTSKVSGDKPEKAKSEASPSAKGTRKTRLQRKTETGSEKCEDDGASQNNLSVETPAIKATLTNDENLRKSEEDVAGRSGAEVTERSSEVSEVSQGQEREVEKMGGDVIEQKTCDAEKGTPSQGKGRRRGRKRRVTQTPADSEESGSNCKVLKLSVEERKTCESSGDSPSASESALPDLEKNPKRRRYTRKQKSGTDGTPATRREASRPSKNKRKRVSGDDVLESTLDAEEEKGNDDDGMREKRKRWTEQIEQDGYAKCDICRNRRMKMASIEKHYHECLKKMKEKDQQDGSENKTPKEEHKKIDINTAKKLWAEQIAETGEAKCMKCFSSRNKISSIEKHYLECVEKSSFEFRCQHCPREFQSAAGYKYHLMAQHTTTQMKDESQSSESDEVNEKLVLRAILKKCGKLRCTTEGCSKSFTTLTGYQYHTKRCGKTNVEEYACEKCSKVYNSNAGLKYHMQNIHPEPPSAEEIENRKKKAAEKAEGADPQFISPSGRVRRQAAIKAVSKVQKLAETGVMEDDEKSKKKRDRDPDAMVADWSRPLYTKPERPTAPKELMAEWREKLKNEGKLVCPYKGCSVNYTNIVSIKFHYASCPKSGLTLDNYKCLICSKEYSTEPAVKYHIQAQHKDELFAFPESDSDDSYDSEASDDSLATPNEDDNDEEGRPSRRAYGPREKFDSKLIPLPDVVNWSVQRNSRYFGVTVHSDWKPKSSDWTEVSKSDSEVYEPVSKESMTFQVEVENIDASSKIRLPRYGSHIDNKTKSITFYAGGPIWSMAWCPLPLGVSSTANQFAAISCHRNYQDIHHCEKSYHENGLIQLWNFGVLKNAVPDKPPNLSLGIAHDYGSIWDMKWCPSGGWEDPEQPGNEAVSRLGLLALACSDGRLRILSIPHPHNIRNEDTDTLVYTVKPCAVLEPNPNSGFPVDKQCLCVEWSPDIHHRKIAAGFYGGNVALWDLTTSSPLLKTSPPLTPMDTYYPYHIFRAHLSYVSGISWCTMSETFLSTAGADRHLKFWDLRNTSSPVNSVQVGLLMQCLWPAHWNACCVGQDNSVTGNHSHVGIHWVETGFHEQKPINLTIINACIWSLSFSEWLNTLTASDSLGHVLGVVLPDVHRFNVYTKGTYRRRFPIYTVSIVKRDPQGRPETIASNAVSDTAQEKAQPSGDGTAMETVVMETEAENKAGGQASEEAESRDKLTSLDMGAKDGETSVKEGKIERETVALVTKKDERDQTNVMKKDDASSDAVNIRQDCCTCDRTTDKVESKTTDKAGSFKDGDQLLNEDRRDCDNCRGNRTADDNSGRTTISPGSLRTDRHLQRSENSGRTSERGRECLLDDKEQNEGSKSEALVNNMDKPVNAQSVDATTSVDKCTQGKTKSKDGSAANEKSQCFSQSGRTCDQVAKMSTAAQAKLHRHLPNQTQEILAKNDAMRHDTVECEVRNSHTVSSENPDITAKSTRNGDLDSPSVGNQTATSEGNENIEAKTCSVEKSTDTKCKSEPTAQGEITKETEDPLPSDYAGLHEDYCLVYQDANLTSFVGIHKSKSFQRVHGDNLKAHPKPDHFPVESVNKICWNPNLGSHQWLLSGGNAGLVRLHFIKALRQRAAEKAMSTFSKRSTKRKPSEQQEDDGEEEKDEEEELDDQESVISSESQQQAGELQPSDELQQPR